MGLVAFGQKVAGLPHGAGQGKQERGFTQVSALKGNRAQTPTRRGSDLAWSFACGGVVEYY